MKPLFLVSLPRSGSTMTQAVLSNHDAIATTPEPWVQLMAASFQRLDLVRAKFDWKLGVEALDACAPGQSLVGQAKERLHELADELYTETCERTGATYFLDKTPRYYYILEELYERYPDAKFLILSRNLVSVLLSIYKTWIQSGSPERLDRYLCDLFDGPRYLKSFLDAHGDSERVMSITYESIMQNPEEVFRAIFEWLGLDFDPSMLNYEANDQYQGKFGDPTGVKRGVVAAQSKDLPVRDFRDAFPDREWAGVASGLAAYAESEGLLNPFPEQWATGKNTAAFARVLRRNLILSRNGGVPGAKESFMLAIDSIVRKVKYG
jgi:hypothetical protein